LVNNVQQPWSSLIELGRIVIAALLYQLVGGFELPLVYKLTSLPDNTGFN
jgi:hypothetical protein